MPVPANRKLYALLQAAGIPRDQKETLCQSFSSGRTTHLGQMTDAEQRELFSHLQRQANRTAQPVVRHISPEQVRTEKQRKKLIAVARSMGWEVIGPNGLRQADMQRIYRWVEQYGYLHKHLNDYTADELPKLLSQFEMVQVDTIRRIDNHLNAQ
jgi:ribosomal protein L44E